jgi:cytochrome c553
MKNWFVLTLGLLTIFISYGTSQAAGNPAAGKEKSASCAACHGADGNSINPEWPKLAGQHEGYLVKQLTYFKDGERVNETMKGTASTLTEQDREDLAAYYSSQKVKIGAADPSLVEFGQKIYRSGNASSGVAPCMGCHGPNGAGNPASNYPALRGQNAQYIENQLRGFASGQRHNENAKKMMQILASRMTDREIRAVSSYIQGLH